MYHIQTRARKNSRKFSKTLVSFEKIETLYDWMSLMYVRVGEKPYIFTHIPLVGVQDGMTHAIVTQTVTIGKDNAEVTCSPVKLYEELTA